VTFGAVFGAIVFSLVGSWISYSLVQQMPAPFGRLAAAVIVAFTWSVALGLLLRRRWSRWFGLGAAVPLLAFGWASVANRGAVFDYAALFAALLTALLLAVPATGRFPAPSAPDGAFRRVAGGVLAGIASLSAVILVGLLGSVLFVAWRTPKGSGAPRKQVSSPASSNREAQWLGFAAGVERAKLEGKPILVDFYADWCAPCRTMDRRTFRDPRVLARFSQVIPVRVNVEDDRPRGGVADAEIADRYRVRSFPTVLLLDAEGGEIARRSGYMDAEEFLRWLDRALSGRAVARRAQAPAFSN